MRVPLQIWMAFQFRPASPELRVLIPWNVTGLEDF